MNRRHPSTAVLAASAIVVLLSLVALVVFPLIALQRTERYRRVTAQHVEPARGALNEVNYRLAQQIASLSHPAATGEPQYTTTYRGAIASQATAMEALSQHAGTMGRDFDIRLADLQRETRRWHTVVRQNGNSQGLAARPDYPVVIEAVHRLDEAITRYQASQRREVARLSRIQVWVTAALVLIAVIAASVVLWIIARLRTLAAELQEESRERQSALERERRLVRSRDEILGVVSHDLRGPLTTIALSTQLIPSSSAEERSEYIETILATTGRMERLIEDLLDVTKTENSALSIRREAIDPSAVTEEAIAAYKQIAASKHIELQSSIDRELTQICGDRDRLLQALSTLLGNALKFTPPGGTVRLTVHRRDVNVRFSVSDSGPGISVSDLPHLFEPFWQAKKTAHLGTGLGLKITRAIVEAHDGTLEVTSAPEGGACFAFELPGMANQAP